MKNPALIGKQGKFAQLGGEFVFGPGKPASLQDGSSTDMIYFRKSMHLCFTYEKHGRSWVLTYLTYLVWRSHVPLPPDVSVEELMEVAGVEYNEASGK
jgi:hypothetical protein